MINIKCKYLRQLVHDPFLTIILYLQQFEYLCRYILASMNTEGMKVSSIEIKYHL